MADGDDGDDDDDDEMIIEGRGVEDEEGEGIVFTTLFVLEGIEEGTVVVVVVGMVDMVDMVDESGSLPDEGRGVE